MSYTPVTFFTQQRQTSAAHELALSVVFESGLQHFADSPESYDALPVARRWLRRLPVAWTGRSCWAGTRQRGDDRTARRPELVRRLDRSGRGRRAPAALDFLVPGRRYVARIVEDAPGGGLRSRNRRRVTAKRVLRVQVGRAGGFVARFRPAR